MPELAYVNGEILPIEIAMVPIEDRGYQFGDGVYEFVASYEGRLFMLEEHLDRLERSMGELAFDPIPRSEIKAAIGDLSKRSGYPRAGIYIQISRGVAPPQPCHHPEHAPSDHHDHPAGHGNAVNVKAKWRESHHGKRHPLGPV